jgi:signal transduction histidine kinase
MSIGMDSISLARGRHDARMERLRTWRLTEAGRLVVYAAGVGLLAGLYYGAGRIGLELAYLDGAVAALWPPAGLGLAVLAIFGLRYWPGIVIGDVLLGDFSTPVGTVLGQTAGNTVALLVAAHLFRRLTAGRVGLARVRDVFVFVVSAVVAAGVSACVGPPSLWLGDVIPSNELDKVFRTWFLSDLSGVLVVAPVILAWAGGGIGRLGRRELVEGLVLLTTLLVLLEVPAQRDVPYVVFPVLIIAALRFGPRGAATAIAVVSGVTVWNTAHNAGPFVRESVNDSLLSTQLFVAVAALTSLVLAAVTAERVRAVDALSRAYGELAASRARIVEAGDAERRRLERNLHDGAQQRLVALTLRLRLAERKLEADPEGARALVTGVQSELEQALEELRELARGIHPAVLSDRGLAAAVQALAARATVPVEVAEMPAERLPEPVETAAYYLIAESVTNASKYADASSVTLRVHHSNGLVSVDVVDDGVGGADAAAGSGLRGLADRLAALNGRLVVESRPNEGTRIRAEIPLPAGGEGAAL